MGFFLRYWSHVFYIHIPYEGDTGRKHCLGEPRAGRAPYHRLLLTSLQLGSRTLFGKRAIYTFGGSYTIGTRLHR